MASFGGSSNPNPPKMFTFKTSDDELVKVPVEIVRMFAVVKDFYDGDLDDPAVPENSSFPLPNVSSSALSVIVNACKVCLAVSSKYEAVEKERQKFEADFLGQRSDETIVELVKAADYLYIQELLDFVMPSLRKRFGLEDDRDAQFVYSDEVEEILRRRAASARTPTMATYGGSSDPYPTKMATYGGSSDPNPTKMATYKTSGGQLVKVPVAIAMMFVAAKPSDDGDLDDTELENKIWPISNVSSDVLDIVVYVCRKLLDLRSKYDALKKERQEFDGVFFDQQTDETIVEQVKAANYLEIQELLDFEMPSFRKRFELGDDKGVDFVYMAEFETILLSRAASASEGADTLRASRYVMVM